MIRHPSPNHDARPARVAIDMLVLHYTGMPTGGEALQALCDTRRKVSAHYLVEEDGRVFALVDEVRRAWHAGEACWRGRRDVNARSIGIEIVNPGHEWGYRDFPPAQMRALIALARDVVARHAIPPRHVLAHSDVAPRRKQDPGERFDWRALAAAGVGLWAGESVAAAGAGSEKKGRGGEGDFLHLRRDLFRFGYEVKRSGGALDEELAIVLRAFQRHFRPWRVDGIADAQTRAILERLLVLAEED